MLCFDWFEAEFGAFRAAVFRKERFMIYIACFAVSALFAWLANNKAKNKIMFYIFSAVSIAVVVLLAGLRDFSIGIDTENYMTRALYWDGAIKSATLTDYIYKYIISGYGEPFFALMIGIIAQFTGNFKVFLTLAHLVIITCVYIGAFRLRKHINPEWVLIVFYFFFFNHSLNIIRQYMAMAIVFAFFADILEKKYIRFCLIILLALQFHTISVVAFGLLIVHIILYVPQKIGTMFQRKAALTVVLLIGVLGFSPLVRIAMKIGVLNKRYEFIFDEEKIEPALIIALCVIVGLAAAFYFRKEMRAKSDCYDYFVMCSICYLILLMLTFTVASTKRIALYFGMADMVTLALIESAQTDKKKKWMVRAGILGMAFVYWFYVYVFRGASETIPYIFGLAG